MNIAKQPIHFYASPYDAEKLLQHSLQLLGEQMWMLKNAADYCEAISVLKETKERPAFVLLANEYKQLLAGLYRQLEELKMKVHMKEGDDK